MFLRGYLSVVLGVVAVSGPVWADEVDELFDTLYADKVNQVKRSTSWTDDVQLAAEMVMVAKQAHATPRLVVKLCDTSHQLAMRNITGYETAAEALGLMMKAAPDRKPELMITLSKLRQRQFATARGDAKAAAGEKLIDVLWALADSKLKAGDVDGGNAHLRLALKAAIAAKSDRRTAIQQRIDSIRNEQRLAHRIAVLKQRIKNKDAVAAQELLRVYVIELDQPEEARKYTFLSKDEKWKTNIPLAAKDPTTLTESEAMKLGDWYRVLTTDAPANSKPAMLTRAHRYYVFYLDRHSENDLGRTKATLVLNTVDASLTSMKVEPTSIAKIATSSSGATTRTTSRVPSVATATPPAVPPGRYVRIELVGKEKVLSVGELQVFADDKNVATTGKATQSSKYVISIDVSASVAIDGDALSYTHTRPSDDPWFELDLGREVPIEKIIFWARDDRPARDSEEIRKRIAGYQLSILDADRKVIWRASKAPVPKPSHAFLVNANTNGAAGSTQTP